MSDVLDQALRWRGLNPNHPENICKKCSGAGTRLYGSTATWREGVVGGAAMTYGACNSCWGSGDALNPWPSHKEIEECSKHPSKNI